MKRVRWVNQYAYDITWNGRRVRVYIKRLKLMPVISQKLLRDSAVSLETLLKKSMMSDIKRMRQFPS